MKFSDEQHGSPFVTTHWSIVLAAGDRKSPAAQAALEALCGAYWYPLYVYARRRLGSFEQAQELTQDFFAKILEKNTLAGANRERGRFRSFLLTALKNFLSNEWNRQRAAKRGGGRMPLSLDFEAGESRYQLQVADTLAPDKLFERQWAITLLDVVLQRLQAEFVETGKSRHFELLKEFLVSPAEEHSYATLAVQLEISPEAVRQAAHRLRKRYRQLLRAEVAQTIDNPSEVEDEIKRLFESLGP